MIAANIRDGMTEGEARRQAMLEFGPMAVAEEGCRDVRAFERVLTFGRDLRYGARRLRQTPGLTAAVVVSLGLGIGSSAALFALVNAALLRTIPVRNPEQLVWLDSGSHGRALSYPFYEEVRGDGRFEGMLCAFPTEVNVSAAGIASRTEAELVSGSYFSVLGIQPHLGRLLTAYDDRRAVAVVSHSFWQARLGGVADMVGRTIQINGAAWEVAGVTPPGFGGMDRGYQRDIFVPMGMKPQVTPGWNGLDKPLIAWLSIAGRLKPGVDRERLGGELNAKFQAFQEVHLAEEKALSAAQRQMIRGRRLGLEPLRGAVLEPRVEGHISTLGWMVGLLLGLACVNVAGMLLARGVERRRELATRLAIGASRGRIAGQLLTEALLLGVAGGAAGVAGAWVAVPVLATRFPLAGNGSKLEVPLDWTVVGFTVAVSLLACLAFGLAPAVQATRLNLVSAMPATAGNRFRNILLAAQAGLSVVLLFGAVLFAAELRALLVIDTGYDRQWLLLAEVEPMLNGYDNAARVRLYKALEKRLGEMSIPATLANVAPMSPYHWSSLFLVKGREQAVDRMVRAVAVGDHYFETMGIPLRLGRGLAESDGGGRPRVAVISETLARREFPDESPLGKRFTADLRAPEETTFAIVGVVADANLKDPRDWEHRECVYFRYEQWAWPPQSMVAHVRLARAAAVGGDGALLVLPVAMPRKVEPGYVASAALLLVVMAGAALVTPVWRVRKLEPAAMLKRE